VSNAARAQPDFAGVLRLPAGDCVTLRPVGPQDGGVLQAYVRALSSQSRYNRFLGALHELPPAELERVTHLDREYELALLAETRVDGAPLVVAEARCAFSRDRRECEFALSVADGWHGKGIGTLLVAEVERRAGRLGARRLVGDVLRSNEPMKALSRKTGFQMADIPRDAKLVRIVKELEPSQNAKIPRGGSVPNLPIAA
jgi:GNAT superfamily N-acetyltransferase